MTAAVQPMVIVWGGNGPLLPPRSPGMRAGYTRMRTRWMSEAEPQLRSADDLRRSAEMAAAQAGDRVAYEALLRDCVPLIRAMALRRGVTGGYVEDVVQDVLLPARRAPQPHDPNRSFPAGRRTIADRRAIDLLRRVGRQQAREVHAPLDFEAFVDERAGPADAGTPAGGLVNEALASLPDRQ